MTAPATPAGSPQPGIFGGLPPKPEQLQTAIDRMQSLGPDGQDHTRSANGLVFEDAQGSERAYLQAQHDLFVTVKHNYTGSVGRNRAFSIQGNDFEEVTNGYQAVSVALDRTLEVKGKQSHHVEKDVLLQGDMNHVVRIKQHLFSETLEGGQIHQAKQGILLRVGDASAIMITPESIVIDSAKVYINPGKDIMDAIYAGASPDQAIAARDREARVQAGMQALFTSDVAAQTRTPTGTTVGDAHARGRQQQLWATANGAPTPMQSELTRAGVTNGAEQREAARRAYETMYGDFPSQRPRGTYD